MLARLIAQNSAPRWAPRSSLKTAPAPAATSARTTSPYGARWLPILGGTISSHAINVSLYPKLPYDPVKSFSPVALIGTNANVWWWAHRAPTKPLPGADRGGESQARQHLLRPAGNGTSQHLSGELYKSIAGLDMVHVPYRAAPAIQDVIGGQVPMMLTPAWWRCRSSKAAGARAGGDIQQTCCDAAQRPDDGRERRDGLRPAILAGDLCAPAGVPAPIPEPPADEVGKILKSPEIVERLGKLGMEASTMTPSSSLRSRWPRSPSGRK